MNPRDAHPNPSARTGILLMLASTLLFAGNVLLVRGATLRCPAADGAMASIFRGWVGLAVVAWFFRGRGFEPWNLVRRPLLVGRGAIGGAAILLFYLTIAHLGVARSVILNLTYPVFGALLAGVWLKEPVSWRQLAWMGVALGGLVLFLGWGGPGTGVTRWEWIGLGGAVVAGVAVVLIRLLRHTEHSSTIYASQCLWSAVLALPLGIGRLAELDALAVAGLVAAAVLVSGGQLALTEGFRTLSVAQGSAIQMLSPVMAGLGGMLFFGERLGLVGWLGAALTLGATWRAVQVR